VSDDPISVGLLVMLQAKPGQERALGELLTAALPMAQDEPDTVAWFAYQIDASTYGVVDFFADDSGRQAHLQGQIPAALMAKTDELLASPPQIVPIDTLGVKLPG